MGLLNAADYPLIKGVEKYFRTFKIQNFSYHISLKLQMSACFIKKNGDYLQLMFPDFCFYAILPTVLYLAENSKCFFH